jgi:2'-5' RNA ligase
VARRGPRRVWHPPGMVQALDLTFDRPTDERVRAEWDALRDAGLPSLARHTGASNRPHLTLDSRDEVGAEAEEALADVAERLPLEVRVGTLLLFHARRRWVLARHVVVDAPLLALHQHVHAVLGPGGSPVTAPGRWVPHLTLARGVPDDLLGAALAVVADAPPYTARALRLRRWDQHGQRAWEVPRQASGGRSL